jgi:hypothetical protein
MEKGKNAAHRWTQIDTDKIRRELNAESLAINPLCFRNSNICLEIICVDLRPSVGRILHSCLSPCCSMLTVVMSFTVTTKKRSPNLASVIVCGGGSFIARRVSEG